MVTVRQIHWSRSTGIGGHGRSKYAVKPSKKIEWLTDKGSCYTVAETRSFAKELGLKPVMTLMTSPQSNGMAESFVKTLERDYAKLTNSSDSKTMMAQQKDWFDDYNSYHPHSALGYLPPTLSGRNDRLLKHTGGTGLQGQDQLPLKWSAI